MLENIEERKVGWLSKLIQERIEKNPQFSLRAFAKKVDASPAVISRILSGKRKLTKKMASKIAEALCLPPSEKEEIDNLFNSDQDFLNQDQAGKELSLECFNAMKDWYHYGVTQMINLHSFKEDYKLIGKMLSISEIEAKLAVNRLINLGILDRDENGKLYRTASHFTTTTDIASSGLRHFQKQILEKAIASLENDPLEERDITSITVAIDESKIKEAKQEIKKFRLKMAEFLSEGESTRVYNLGIHLIPISKNIEECLIQKGEFNEMDQ